MTVGNPVSPCLDDGGSMTERRIDRTQFGHMRPITQPVITKQHTNDRMKLCSAKAKSFTFINLGQKYGIDVLEHVSHCNKANGPIEIPSFAARRTQPTMKRAQRTIHGYATHNNDNITNPFFLPHPKVQRGFRTTDAKSGDAQAAQSVKDAL